MKERFITLFLAALLACFCYQIEAANEAKSKTITVDCSKGQKVNDALSNTASELTILIHGICKEDVVVKRDSVTMIGEDPNLDGVEGVGLHAEGAAVLIRGASVVRLENVKITGGPFYGVRVLYSQQVKAVNCRFEGNGVYGAGVAHSFSRFEDSVITGNGFGGAIVEDAGHLICQNCNINNNPSPSEGVEAFHVDRRSQGALINSEVEGLFGVWSNQGSQIYVIDSTIVSAGDEESSGVGAGRNATLDLIGTTVTGSIQAFHESRINVTGSNVTAPEFVAGIGSDSSLLIQNRGATSSNLSGKVLVHGFSNVLLTGSSTVTGDVLCNTAGDVFCDNPANVSGISSCGSCPKP